MFGHLELATIVRRAVRRAGLAVKYSKGFHPAMKLSFDNALPVGMESEHELLFIYLERKMAPDKIINLLNIQLPAGIMITGCRFCSKLNKKSSNHDVYTIRFATPLIKQEQVDHLLSLPELVVEDRSKKGKIRRTDLKKNIESISFIDKTCIEMVLKKYNERTIRPAEILSRGLGMDSEQVQAARIRKIKQG